MLLLFVSLTQLLSVKNKNFIRFTLLLSFIFCFSIVINYFFITNQYKEQKRNFDEALNSASSAAINTFSNFFSGQYALNDITLQTLPNSYTITGENLFPQGSFDIPFNYASQYNTITSYFSNIRAVQNGWCWLIDNPSKYHKVWFAKPYNNTGRFLLLDGALQPNTIFFEQRLQLKKNKTYLLKGQIATVSLKANNQNKTPLWQLASIGIIINTDTFYTTAPPTLYTWKAFSLTFKAKTDSLTTIKYFDANTSSMYNDFGIDECQVLPIQSGAALTRSNSEQIYADTAKKLSAYKIKVLKEMFEDELNYKNYKCDYTFLIRKDSVIFYLDDTLLRPLATVKTFLKQTKFKFKNGGVTLHRELAIYKNTSFEVIVNNYKAAILSKMKFSVFLSTFFFLSSIIVIVLLFRTYQVQKKDMQLRNDMSTNLTHELKTPVTTIISALEAIKLLPDDQKKERYINGAIKQAFKLDGLINKALQLKALEDKTIIINVEKINLTLLIQGCIDTNYSHYKSAIQLQNFEQAFYIFGDKFHIENVVNTVIENAIKYSPVEFKLIVKLEQHPQKVVLSFTDFGIGIDKAYTKKIFNKYFRVPSPTHNVKGYGLGLSYVKTIMEKHQGKVFVESNLQKGTTFTLQFKTLDIILK